MTTDEFKAWLDGYMTDRAAPDAKVIAEKAKELRGGLQIDPAKYPATGYKPAVDRSGVQPIGMEIRYGDASPFWQRVTCSTTAKTTN